MKYTELHLHDHYSTLDGLNTPAEYMLRAKELGMTHLAQTNHGTLGGSRDFQISAREAGIIPIIGIEAYISATDRFDKRSKASRSDGTSVFNHIILLSQNETGLKNLYAMNEKAFSDESFYHKPRIDIDLLEEYSDGIIVLSGCLNGLLCKAIEAGDMDGALNWAHKFKSIFRDRFYIELQTHNPVETNQGLLHIARSMNIKPVVTSDCHYARKEDLWATEAMLILSTNPKENPDADFNKSQKMDIMDRFNYLYPERKMSFQDIEIYLKSAEEQLAGLKAQGLDVPEAITNTMEIAGSVEPIPFHQNLDLLPRPTTESADMLLEKRAWAGLKAKGLHTNQEYIDRLREELDIIQDKNFSTYFLIVSNMLRYAKRQGIRVGPGRGSAVGSLVCYTLDITQIDPLKYGLLFFRFINPERNDFPDIDSDFEDRRRNEIKEYLRRQYKHVGSIATRTYLSEKNVIRDAAKVYRVPLGDVNKALKTVEKFEEFEKSPNTAEFRKKYPEVLELAHALRGRIRSAGMHAAGVVLSSKPLADLVPIETATDPNDKSGPRVPLVAYDMNEVADIGLLKMDILGLKCLSVIEDTVKAIEKRRGKQIDMLEVPLDDPQVYQMLSEGYTKGVFQCEASAYTQLILRMGGVWNFDDLAASNALGRPGAANTIGPEYIARKNGHHDVSYIHDCMQQFTEETFGTIVYQEQVMLTMTELAGMSMATADKVRKIIGKKRDVKEFDVFKEEFVKGASEKVSVEMAEGLWESFNAHADYSFNKSHAVAYSLLSYWTAWLKVHYPLEFVYSMLKNEGDPNVRTEYLIEAKRMGVKILLPHVNKSDIDFSIDEGAIRFGIANIKGFATKSATRLIKERPFTDFRHLREVIGREKNGLHVGMIGALNAIGAAQFPDNPKRGNERDNLYEYLNIPSFENKEIPPRVRAQFTPLDDFEEKGVYQIMAMVKNIKRGKGWARVELVDESGTAGIFHDQETTLEKGQMYAMLVADNRIERFAPVEKVTTESNNTFVQHLFADGYPDLIDHNYVVVAFRPYTTKAGKKMAYAVFAREDKSMFRVMAFPSMFHRAWQRCSEGNRVFAYFGQTDDGSYFLKEVE